MKRIIRNAIVLSVVAVTPLSLFLINFKASAASLSYRDISPVKRRAL